MRNSENYDLREWWGTAFLSLGRTMAMVMVITALHLMRWDLMAAEDSAAPTLIGRWATAGYTFSVKVSGHLAYVANGTSGLAIVDVANPAKPVSVGSYVPTAAVVAVCMDGNIAYLACTKLGVLALDVSDPAHPALLGTFDTQGYARDMALQGTTLYVADYSGGLVLLDVSNPRQLRQLGVCALPGQTRRLEAVGNLVYVVDEDYGIRVVDVRNPAQPMEIGQFPTGDSPRCVHVADGVAYVGLVQQGLRILDVSTPAHPVLLSSMPDVGEVFGIQLMDGILLAANGVRGLRVLDVRDPRAPQDLLRTPLGNYAEELDIAGGTAYVVNADSGLAVLALAAAARQTISPPVLHDVYVTDGTVQLAATASSGLPVSFTLQSGPATLDGDTLTIQGLGKVTLIAHQHGNRSYYPAQDVSVSFNVLPFMDLGKALDAPSLAWTSSGASPWFAQQTVTHDGSAALSSGFLGGFQQSVVETVATGPGELEFWWKISTQSATDTLQFQIDGSPSATVSGSRDWTSAKWELMPGPHSLRWIYSRKGTAAGPQDRAWLDQLTYVNAYGTPVITNQPLSAAIPGGGTATLTVGASGYGLTYQWYHGDQLLKGATNTTLRIPFFYRDDLGEYTVHVASRAVITVSDPARLTLRPRIAGSLVSIWHDSSGGEAQGLLVSGTRLYLAQGAAGVRVFDITQPDGPQLLGACDTMGSAHGIALVGSMLYVAARSAGLEIADVTVPGQPTRIGAVRLEDEAFAVAVQGLTAYVATRSGGLQIVDVSNPVHPVRVAAYTNLTAAYDVALTSGKAFVADAQSGLEILDISFPAEPVAIGRLALPGKPSGVRVAGNLAYVGAGVAGVQIVDVSQPAAPFKLGAVETPAFAYGTEAIGDLIYIACDGGGVRVVDASSPEAPLNLGGLSTGGRAYAVRVASGHAYVADGIRGLLCFALTEPSDQTILIKPIPTQSLSAGTLGLNSFARSSSGLPLQYQLISGPASVNGNGAFFLGAGHVVIQASQPGDDLIYPAARALVEFDITTNSVVQTSPTLVVQAKSAPAETGLLLSWPSTYTGFNLERLSRIGAAAWEPVALPQTLSTNGDRLQVLIPSPAGTGFYRLQR